VNGPEAAAPRAWRGSLRVYLQPRILSMLLLGFSAGLPFYLVFQSLSAWLRQAHIQRSTIGMFAWVGLAYSLKFLWAPIVDRVPIPLLSRLLGEHRAERGTQQKRQHSDDNESNSFLPSHLICN